MSKQAHYKGFIKRAAEYGLTEIQAQRIYKKADDDDFQNPLQGAGEWLGQKVYQGYQGLNNAWQNFQTPTYNPTTSGDQKVNAWGEPQNIQNKYNMNDSPNNVAAKQQVIDHENSLTAPLTNKLHQMGMAPTSSPVDRSQDTWAPTGQGPIPPTTPQAPAPAAAGPAGAPGAGGAPGGLTPQQLQWFRHETGTAFNPKSVADAQYMSKRYGGASQGQADQAARMRAPGTASANLAQAHTLMGGMPHMAGAPGSQPPAPGGMRPPGMGGAPAFAGASGSAGVRPPAPAMPNPMGGPRLGVR